MTDALLVFSRFPRLGKVKTRLSTLLHPAQCLQFHLALLLDTIDRTSDLDMHRYLFLADCSQDEMDQFLGEYELSSTIGLCRQHGKDLGERMWNAYQQIHSEENRVVFLGSDSPSLPLSHIREAGAQLDEFPVVLGPVEDGGYCLLALARPQPELFRDIDWGTERVLEQTLAKLQPGQYFLLPEWYDVDTESDLGRLRRDLASPVDGFPERTAQFINSLHF